LNEISKVYEDNDYDDGAGGEEKDKWSDMALFD
jgi:hypothetical protein